MGIKFVVFGRVKVREAGVKMHTMFFQFFVCFLRFIRQMTIMHFQFQVNFLYINVLIDTRKAIAIF